MIDKESVMGCFQGPLAGRGKSEEMREKISTAYAFPRSRHALSQTKLGTASRSRLAHKHPASQFLRHRFAELRGSLQPFARGAVVTTSHFSKAAIREASESGKNPIVLLDGHRFATLISKTGCD